MDDKCIYVCCRIAQGKRQRTPLRRNHVWDDIIKTYLREIRRTFGLDYSLTIDKS
jgi:hypothetical protein